MARTIHYYCTHPKPTSREQTCVHGGQGCWTNPKSPCNKCNSKDLNSGNNPWNDYYSVKPNMFVRDTKQKENL